MTARLIDRKAGQSLDAPLRRFPLARSAVDTNTLIAMRQAMSDRSARLCPNMTCAQFSAPIQSTEVAGGRAEVDPERKSQTVRF